MNELCVCVCCGRRCGKVENAASRAYGCMSESGDCSTPTLKKKRRCSWSEDLCDSPSSCHPSPIRKPSTARFTCRTHNTRCHRTADVRPFAGFGSLSPSSAGGASSSDWEQAQDHTEIHPEDEPEQRAPSPAFVLDTSACGEAVSSAGLLRDADSAWPPRPATDDTRRAPVDLATPNATREAPGAPVVTAGRPAERAEWRMEARSAIAAMSVARAAEAASPPGTPARHAAAYQESLRRLASFYAEATAEECAADAAAAEGPPRVQARSHLGTEGSRVPASHRAQLTIRAAWIARRERGDGRSGGSEAVVGQGVGGREGGARQDSPAGAHHSPSGRRRPSALAAHPVYATPREDQWDPASPLPRESSCTRRGRQLGLAAVVLGSALALWMIVTAGASAPTLMRSARSTALFGEVARLGRRALLDRPARAAELRPLREDERLVLRHLRFAPRRPALRELRRGLCAHRLRCAARQRPALQPHSNNRDARTRVAPAARRALPLPAPLRLPCRRAADDLFVFEFSTSYRTNAPPPLAPPAPPSSPPRMLLPFPSRWPPSPPPQPSPPAHPPASPPPTCPAGHRNTRGETGPTELHGHTFAVVEGISDRDGVLRESGAPFVFSRSETVPRERCPTGVGREWDRLDGVGREMPVPSRFHAGESTTCWAPRTLVERQAEGAAGPGGGDADRGGGLGADRVAPGEPFRCGGAPGTAELNPMCVKIFSPLEELVAAQGRIPAAILRSVPHGWAPGTFDSDGAHFWLKAACTVSQVDGAARRRRRGADPLCRRTLPLGGTALQYRLCRGVTRAGARSSLAPYEE